MLHRILQDAETPLTNDYLALSDQDKNSRLAALLCQKIDNDLSVSETISPETLKLIDAVTRCFNTSIQFKSGDNAIDIKDRLNALLGVQPIQGVSDATTTDISDGIESGTDTLEAPDQD